MYLLRDRDGKYGEEFIHKVESMGIEQALIAVRSPWQNPYVERVIGLAWRCINFRQDGINRRDTRMVRPSSLYNPCNSRDRSLVGTSGCSIDLLHTAVGFPPDSSSYL